MYCPKCGALNEEDAIFCKHCGFLLKENDLTDEDKKSENDKNDKDSKKDKKKNKTKHKNNNKTKHKNKTKVKKEKPSKSRNPKSEKGMTFGQKLLMFILFLLVFTLIGGLLIGGYYYYKSLQIEVPDLINMTYEEAAITLVQKDLKISKVEEVVDNPEQDGIVIDQNKKPGKKVRENTTVKVTVGVYEKTYTLEDFEGQDASIAISTLESNDVKYEITYTDTTDYENNVVISQSPKAGEIIKEDDKVTLEVARNTSSNDTEESDPTEDNQPTNQNPNNNEENNQTEDNSELTS